MIHKREAMSWLRLFKLFVIIYCVYITSVMTIGTIVVLAADTIKPLIVATLLIADEEEVDNIERGQ